MRPTPTEDQESHPILKEHPYAKVSYSDIMKKIITEKVQMSYIRNKFGEAMNKELNSRKTLNIDINVSRLKTIFD